jgi:tetratricopeptide (TPR) repeat protein
MIDATQIDPYGRLSLRNPQEISSTYWQTPQAGCAIIWQARVWASHDLKKARELLAASDTCYRSPSGTSIWKGNFEYLSGDLAQAELFWSEIPDKELLTYTKHLILGGETQFGLAILAVLTERTENWAGDSTKTDLLIKLGDLFRYAARDEEATVHYQQAWDAGERSYWLAFYLGRGLQSRGDCLRAVDVLNEGLKDRDFVPEFPTQFDLSYYEELGRCYLTLGQTEGAHHAFELASQILANGRKSWPQEVYLQRLERFNRIFATISGK